MDTEKPQAMRMDIYLARTFDWRSRREWKDLLRQGRVRWQGRVARAADLWAPHGAVLEYCDPRGQWHPLVPGELRRPEDQSDSIDAPVPNEFWLRRATIQAIQALSPPQPSDSPPQLLPLYRDQKLMVFNKPAGMPSHPLSVEDPALCLADIAVLADPGCATAGDIPREAGLVHRLDTDTSGLIVCALNHTAWLEAAAIFRGSGDGGDRAAKSQRAVKTYLALLWGTLPGDCVAEFPVAHHLHKAGAMVAVGAPGSEGQYRGTPRAASSRVQLLGHVTSHEGHHVSLAAVVLEQGQRHQVRVHCAALGYPLWGDALYGNPASCAPLGTPGGTFMAQGHTLHAWKLSFPWPHAPGGRLNLQASLPLQLAQLLTSLGLAGAGGIPGCCVASSVSVLG